MSAMKFLQKSRQIRTPQSGDSGVRTRGRKLSTFYVELSEGFLRIKKPNYVRANEHR